MKVGIVGAGNIVRICLKALDQVDNVHCSAIWTREQEVETAQALADSHNIGRVYTRYEDLLTDENVDIVYIGIINNLHFEYAKKALDYGKHVICEKPFTSTLEEMQTLQQLAKTKGLFLFEAITLLYSPNFQYIQRKLDSVGPVKLIQCNFSQYSSRYAKYLQGEVLPAFDPALSGGALYDINIYNIHFVVGLFGKPQRIHYAANLGHNGIDTSGVVTMEYEGFNVSCSGAKDSSSPNFAIIQGEEGFIKLDGATNFCPSVELSAGGVDETFNGNQHDNHMVNEFAAFRDIFHAKDFQTCYRYLDHSVAVIEVLVEARKSAGIHFPADDVRQIAA